jgi:hypothetical protein
MPTQQIQPTMKTKTNPVLLTCSALLALCLTANVITSANAASSEVYGNLGTVADSTTSNTVGYLNSTQSNQSQAQGFSLGLSDYNLTSLELGLGSTGSPAPLVQIFSNISGAPGSALATFSLSAGPVSAINIYNFTGSFTAAKNTSYWVVLSNTNSASLESYEWYSNDAFTSPTGQNASGISYLGTKESDNGGSWNSTLPSVSIRVSGTAIPEPSALALLGLGTVGLGIVRLVARRRREG